MFTPRVILSVGSDECSEDVCVYGRDMTLLNMARAFGMRMIVCKGRGVFREIRTFSISTKSMNCVQEYSS